MGSPALPQRVVERFILREIVGSGAEGVVYRAVDRRLHRIVAVKAYRSPGDRYSENAAVAASRLFHDNIVVTLDVFAQPDALIIIQEFLEGIPLSQRPPAVDQSTVSILLRVAEAMDYCHKSAVAHRDLKCSNVILVADGRVKLVDFGLAKDFSAKAFMTRSIEGDRQVGTLAYMAPEVIYDTFGFASDVWSFGALSLRCLLGRYPYSAQNIYKIMAEMKDAFDGKSDESLRLAFDDVRSSFSIELVDILAACFETVPRNRPTFSELKKVLSRSEAAY